MNFLKILMPKKKAPDIPVYQSRWGWHPVPYEDFLVLKALHKRFWKAIRSAARWSRWTAKTPHNRRGPEPRLDPLFHNRDESFARLEKAHEWARKWSRDGKGRGRLWTWSVPMNPVMKTLLADYQSARLPREKPEHVGPLDMSVYQEISLSA